MVEAKAAGKSQQTMKAELAKEVNLDRLAMRAGFNQPSNITIGETGSYKKVQEADSTLLPTLFCRNFIDTKASTMERPSIEMAASPLKSEVRPKTFPEPT